MRSWRRALLVIVLVLAAGLTVAVASGRSQQGAAEMPGCIEPAPCVYVTPDPRTVDDEGTEYTFVGQGWRPGRVTASYSEFCPPEHLCDVGARSARVTADERGRFTLTIRYHGGLEARMTPGADGDPRETWFRQRRDGRSVKRDAFPPPPPSTPEERAEAAAVAAAVHRAHVALDKREDDVGRAGTRGFHRHNRCAPDPESRNLKERQYRVGDALRILAMADAEYSVVRGELEAFARDLGGLELRDPVLRAAVDTWRQLIDAPRPWTLERVCAAQRRWARSGFAYSKRPVDIEDVERLSLELAVITNEVLDEGGARLRALHAGRLPSWRFGGGLLERGEPHGIFG